MGIENCSCSRCSKYEDEVEFSQEPLNEETAAIRIQHATKRFKAIKQVSNKIYDVLVDKLRAENVEVKEISKADFDGLINSNPFFNKLYSSRKSELDEHKLFIKENNYLLKPLQFNNLEDGTSEFYYGSFNCNGDFSGEGTHIFQNNCIYVGEFKNNEYNGKGLMITDRGDNIYGDWEDGLCTGKGELEIVGNLKYKGEFKDHKKNGYGVEEYEDGSSYSGNFVNGQKSGCGKYVLPNGEYYEGQFLNDVYNGEGVYKWVNENRIYKGQFKDGNIEGVGINKYSDGSTYKGSYVKGFKQGKGSYSWPNGKKFYGNWLNNELHGTGYYIDGDKKYDVTFRFGKMITSNTVDGSIKEENNSLTNAKADNHVKDILDKNNIDNIGDIEDITKFICPLCQSILVDPIKCISCNQDYCKECINELKTKNCIRCGKTNYEEDLQILGELISKIIIKCPKCNEKLNYKNACDHRH